MRNSEYWKKRFEILEQSAVSKGAKYYYSLDNEYRRASREIQNQIAAWYTRLAHNNKLTLAEARKFLTTSELAEFKWTVKDYIKFGAENGVNQQWMKELENASAKVHISRLEALKVQLQQQMEVLYGNQVDGIDTLARETYSEGYYHTAYEIQKGYNIGWDLQSLDSRRIEKVLSKPWTADGLTFRDKCWKQKTELVSTVSTELTQTLMRGLAPDKAIKNIAERFNVAKSKAGRLVMTESAYFASVAQKDCFNDLDVEKFEIVATLDSRTSAICQELDGQVFDMKDYEPGVTAPPFHPWCRTTTVPYFEDNYGERIARDLEGNTYYVPSDMTYKEWKKSQDEKFGVGAVDKQRKMLYNTSVDKAQFARYKGLLGEKAPKTFADFQKIKYSDEYASLKLQYADAKIQSRIKSGEISTTVLEGKQGKHILGHNNYIAGRSYLNSNEDVQSLVNKHAGTGRLIRDASGKWTHKEVVIADHPVGFDVSMVDGSATETSTFTIHYSKKGVHIVPKKE